ncbi:MAG: arginine--tRNA ligase, partial [Candidatus Bathyarchaeota archaeon]
MTSISPFADFRKACKLVLEDALKKRFPKSSISTITFEIPPNPAFGELSSSICFELAKKTRKKPLELARQVADAINTSQSPLIQSVNAAGGGYINFKVDFAKLASITLNSAKALDTEYGYVKTDNPRRIIVEHTSVNPISPIHVGHARNPVLGDALARILQALGNVVSRHYYVDDVGRQSAVAAYGYERLSKPQPEEKPDHTIGRIYTITSCITEIQRLKGKINQAKESTSDETAKLQEELDDWASAAVDLEGRYPELFNQLLTTISKDESPESRMTQLFQDYEAGEKEAKQLIRNVCQICLDGFKETLGKAGIFLDSWDWESDFSWSGEVTQTLDKLKKTKYVFQAGNVLEFDAEKVAQDLKLKEPLGLREDYEIPSLTLVRADGTTLYTTRDIPYSLWKLQRAEQVINVVGMEQKLSQLQLKLALYALGHQKKAENLVHFAYNLVNLPGYTMSSRRGRYVTMDEVMEEAVKRAYEEVSKRSP